uniref:Galactose oxidase n=1 Tax=Mycena chlorophos TaxID=658473 RepID=A0ABQ0LAP9_MYCCL|nr:predicted protein [Mycena chlorophos]
MLFGGFGEAGVSGHLICVDLNNLIWHHALEESGEVQARTGATMIAHKNRLFIFGGRDSLDDDATIFRSFSIATLDADGWKWTVSDRALPPNVPNLGYLMRATLVYGGKKILLTEGNVTSKKKSIRLSASTTFLFHTQHYTFEDASFTRGVFPHGLAWHRIGYITAPPPTAVQEPQPGPRPAKRPRLLGYEAEEPFPPSAIIVGWVKHAGDNLSPEIWQYMLPPTQSIVCLELKEKVYRLDLDLEDFAVVGNRMILLGNSGKKTSLPEPEDEEAAGSWKRWDVAVEISFAELKHGENV